MTGDIEQLAFMGSKLHLPLFAPGYNTALRVVKLERCGSLLRWAVALGQGDAVGIGLRPGNEEQ